MIGKRLVMGAVALASVVGMAVGPVSSAGAAAPKTVRPHNSLFYDFHLNCASCTVTTKSIHFSGSGNVTIAFKDSGEFGDSYRATYIDSRTVIRGNCSVSSLSSYKTSLRVHIPGSRNFQIRISWCRGPGDFPAAGHMRVSA